MTRPVIQIYNAQTYETLVREMNDEEYVDWQSSESERTAEQAKAIRDQRNEKLNKSDWTQLFDSSANKDDWIAYRKSLRDLTKQVNFPWEISWPQEPGA